jgi:transcriptional regulator with PAS, ATPase and Fis domain
MEDRTYEPLGGTNTLRTNARIVTATNQDLAAMVEEGRFRRDLYYRINVIELDLPALRDRPEDLSPLIRHFLNQLALLHEKPGRGLTPEAMRALMNYRYPGNIRELENILEHGFVLAAGPLIGVEHLPGWLVRVDGDPTQAESLEECERRVIRSALAKNQGNRIAAAKELGIHKSTLYRRMRRLGFPSSDTPDTSPRA